MNPGMRGLWCGMFLLLAGVWLGGCASAGSGGAPSLGSEITSPARVEAPEPLASTLWVSDQEQPEWTAFGLSGPPAWWDIGPANPLSQSSRLLSLQATAHEGTRPVELELELELERDQELGENDPFEPFNQATFGFNRGVDRFVLKPVAILYDALLPDLVQRRVGSVFHNIGVVPRVLNNALQLKFGGMTRELSRFLINSTLGIAGLFDVAKHGFGLEKSEEDTGQTLAVYGVGPGPYLVLPFLPPFTVRDGFGATVDLLLNPLIYFAPLPATVGIRGTDTVNERSLNLEFYEGAEEAALDLYTAVRNAYFQQRRQAILE